MSGFPILDLVIGMIFIYFLLSVICSSVVEMFLTLAGARARLLQEWLCTIFNKNITYNGETMQLGQAIVDHCTVTALSGNGKAPSYIDAKNFASALLEKLTFDPKDPKSIATDLNTFITKIENTTLLSTELQRVFLSYAYEARDAYELASTKTTTAVGMFRSKIEDWYNSSMDRLTGNLKRKYSRPYTIWVAVITILLLNADSISLAKYLYSNPEERASVVAQAYQAAKDSTAIFTVKAAGDKIATNGGVAQLTQTLQNSLDSINKAKAALNENLPLGWNTEYFKTLFPNGNFADGILSLLLKITGLTCTVFAIMMGAPFWFDLLNKVANLRGTGNKPPDNSNSTTTAAVQQPAAVTVTLNTKADEEAVG